MLAERAGRRKLDCCSISFPANPVLFDLVREHLSDSLDLVPCDGGMQVAGWLPRDTDDRRIAETGDRRI